MKPYAMAVYQGHIGIVDGEGCIFASVCSVDTPTGPKTQDRGRLIARALNAYDAQRVELHGDEECPTYYLS